MPRKLSMKNCMTLGMLKSWPGFLKASGLSKAHTVIGAEKPFHRFKDLATFPVQSCRMGAKWISFYFGEHSELIGR
jgi:hypothetical protein